MYLNIGDVVAAEGSLNTALELNPQWVPALINLADIYRGNGRATASQSIGAVRLNH